jgi:hypothetical protein
MPQEEMTFTAHNMRTFRHLLLGVFHYNYLFSRIEYPYCSKTPVRAEPPGPCSTATGSDGRDSGPSGLLPESG